MSLDFILFVGSIRKKNLEKIRQYLQRFFIMKRIESSTHGTSNHVGRSDSGNDLRLRYTAHPWEERRSSLLKSLSYILLLSI